VLFLEQQEFSLGVLPSKANKHFWNTLSPSEDAEVHHRQNRRAPFDRFFFQHRAMPDHLLECMRPDRHARKELHKEHSPAICR